MSTSTAKFLREVSKSDDFQINTLVANKYYTVKHHIVDYWDGEFDTSMFEMENPLSDDFTDNDGKFVHVSADEEEDEIG